MDTRMKPFIYDCTLRDGGYVNNWQWADDTLRGIVDACVAANIDYIEIGYLDKVNYSAIEKHDDTKITVMIDYNKREHYIIPEYGTSCIDGIRVAAHKDAIFDCFDYIDTLKDMGYTTAIQAMGITNYSMDDLHMVADAIPPSLDILTVADSNGSLVPDDVNRIMNVLAQRQDVAIGFHSHNNIQMSLANSIVAMKSGANIIDCSFNGIGRGAGNLPTELFFAYMNKHHGCTFNLNSIIRAVLDYIVPLKREYHWGYSIPTMLSGVEGIHPFYARDVSKRDVGVVLDVLQDIGKTKPMKYYGKTKIVGVIPARYESSRFLGKPLTLIHGRPMIWWVYNNAVSSNVFDSVFVATDSSKIDNECKIYGIPCVLTSSECKTGTDRIAEVSQHNDADLYVNIQGDEPLIMPETISSFVTQIMELGEVDRVAFNAMTECCNNDADNYNVPKVVVDGCSDLLYISRCRIPHDKASYLPKYYKELGLHAYTKHGLNIFSSHSQGQLEKTEEVEFLRFLEHGVKVKMIYLSLPFVNHAVDMPSDVGVVEKIMEKNGIHLRYR